MQIVYKDHSPCSLNHVDLCLRSVTECFKNKDTFTLTSPFPALAVVIMELWFNLWIPVTFVPFMCLVLDNRMERMSYSVIFSCGVLEICFCSPYLKLIFGGDPWKTTWKNKKSRFDNFPLSFLFILDLCWQGLSRFLHCHTKYCLSVQSVL